MNRSLVVALLLAGALFAAVSAQQEAQHKVHSCVRKGKETFTKL
jgi:hypothetical protein